MSSSPSRWLKSRVAWQHFSSPILLSMAPKPPDQYRTRSWPLVVALKHVQALQANIRLQAAGCARAENLARLVTRGFDEREQTIDVLERAWLLEDIRREESGE